MQRVDGLDGLIEGVDINDNPVIVMKDWTEEAVSIYFINADGSIKGKACQTSKCNRCPAGKMFEEECWHLPANENLERGWFIDSDEPIADGREEI